MQRFISRKNDVDLTRLTATTTLAGTDLLLVETTGSGDLRRKVTFSNLLASVTAGIINSIVPTGVLVPWLSLSAPSGWVMASGRTVGSAASGATERANADTAALYSLLWQAFGNTELAIQDSTGTPTTRGVSASADYAANKRLPLPDLRDRAIIGLANMGGTDAARISLFDTTIIGAAGGAEKHSLVEANIPQHTHNTNVPATTAASAATGTDVAIPGTAAAVTSTAYGQSTPTPVPTLPPALVLPYIIKL